MRSELGRIVGLAPAPRGRLALSILLGATAVVFGIGLMTSAGYLIARAAEQPAILSLTTVIVAVRFFGLGRPIVRYLERLVSHDLAFRVLARIRVHFYERIEPLAPAGLEQYRRGDLVSRMVGDVDALQGLYLRGLGPPLVALVAGAIAIGVALAILPEAGAALAVGLLCGGILVPAVSGLLGRRAGRVRAAVEGHLGAEIVELLRGAPELVVYGREEEALARVDAADRLLSRLARKDALAAGVADGLMVVVTGATVVAVVAAGVSASAGGSLDRVFVATLALLSLASFEAVAGLPQAARELSTTLAVGGRISEIVERVPTVSDPRAPLSAPVSPALAFERVGARYSESEPLVLDGFELTLPPGGKIALVGPSGSGKTTAVNLLLRFLDPVGGRVTLGGHDLREYAQEDIRRTIAVAGQDSYLFSTTIGENVRIGRPGATDAEVEDALRRARAGDWVASLPDGLETHVGEEGAAVSGGQRQRIALARALLSNAPVLVLDEPTAHLDPDTAEELVRDVLSAAESRSVLLITHRPEGLDLVDEVVDMPSRR
jgi:ATP-binding cassette, subfamily C, bacterial CydC